MTVTNSNGDSDQEKIDSTKQGTFTKNKQKILKNKEEKKEKRKNRRKEQ